jgi:multiple sugar transport system substrate-binding protein
MGESWDAGVFTDQFPTRCDWAVAPIPTYDGKFHGKSRAMLVGGFWNINNQTRYKLEAWEVIKWFSQYEVRGLMYEQGKNIDSDPVVVRDYIKKPIKIRGFAEFAETLDQDYLATYPYLPDWQGPAETPFSVLQEILLYGGDLASELKRIDQLWNDALDLYYQEHPDYKRGWNIYPEFDRAIGILGSPQVTAPGIFDSNLVFEESVH